MRDAAITSLMKGSGLDYQSFRSASTYINNSYWGLYNIREKVSENFIASKHDVNPNEIDLLENNAEIVDGDNSEYIDLINFVEQNNLAIASNYDYVSSKIDIDNFIMYNVAQIYMDNQDWPGNNNKFWKSPEINGSGFCMIQILVLVDNGGTLGMLSMVFTIILLTLFFQEIKLIGQTHPGLLF